MPFYLSTCVRAPLFQPPSKIRENSGNFGKKYRDSGQRYVAKFSQNLRPDAFHTSSIRKNDVLKQEFAFFVKSHVPNMIIFFFFFSLADYASQYLHISSRDGNHRKTNGDSYNN